MGDFNLIEVLGNLGIKYVPFLFALCFHEFAHAYVAKMKGDNTADMMGRLTMNPFVHADLLGTFILPIAGILAGVGGMNGGGGFIFGWAKPVPVNERNLRQPRTDMSWVAAAGPLSNLLLGFIATFLYVLCGIFIQGDTASAVKAMLGNFIVINVLLCVFNLIPLHPLDGGKILARFIPREWNNFLEEHQNTLQILLIVFFVAGGFRFLQGPMLFLIAALEHIVLAMLSPFL